MRSQNMEVKKKMSELAKTAIEMILPFLKSQPHLDFTDFKEEDFKQYILKTEFIACPLCYGVKCKDWNANYGYNPKKHNCLTCVKNNVHQCKHLVKYDSLIEKEFNTNIVNLWEEGYSLLQLVEKRGKINERENEKTNPNDN